MDYIHKVHSGEYKEEELKGDSKAFVAGMREVQNLVANQLQTHEVFDEDAQKTIIGKMRAEIAEEIIDGIVKDLETDICFVIVACLDEQAAQKEDKEE